MERLKSFFVTKILEELIEISRKDLINCLIAMINTLFRGVSLEICSIISYVSSTALHYTFFLSNEQRKPFTIFFLVPRLKTTSTISLESKSTKSYVDHASEAIEKSSPLSYEVFCQQFLSIVLCLELEIEV